MEGLQKIVERQTILTVTELTQKIRILLQDAFPNVWVEGEISNFRVPTSGHFYFSLKDEMSQIKVVMWRSNNRFLKFEPKDGLHVIVKGSITVFESRGEYQLNAEYVEPKGIGALQLRFEQLKERLEKEGLFDKSKKKAIPFLPQKIAIVTSPKGAVIQDILSIIERRSANVEILIYPVRVQGEGSEYEIAEAIDMINKFQEIEVIILARGGGSIEDLWAFNEEIVARAIFRSKIPIISAVGHETDFTIADFVADLRAETPSSAAQIVTQNKLELINIIENNMVRLRSTILRIIDYWKLRHEQVAKRLISPQQRVNNMKQRLDELSERIEINFRNFIKMKGKVLELVSNKLNALSPLAVLERGYSITQKITTNQIIRDVKELSVGEEVSVRVHKGRFTTIVKDKYD